MEKTRHTISNIPILTAIRDQSWERISRHELLSFAQASVLNIRRAKYLSRFFGF